MASKRADDDLPIDIHYDKLLDWLISRKKIQPKWQDSIRDIREKINSALGALPNVPEITSILGNTYVNYFHCVEIFKLLEKAESEEKGGKLKNIFGQYSSSLLKTWDGILNAYRKDSVYLAESARTMVQNVQYEIPTMRKSIQESERLIGDLTRKRGNFERSSAAFQDKFQQACQKMGIKGDDIRGEVTACGRQMEVALDALQAKAQEPKLGECIDFYRAFVRFQLQASLGSQFDESQLSPLVPTLVAAREFDIKSYSADNEFLSLDQLASDDLTVFSSSLPTINFDIDDLTSSGGDGDGDGGEVPAMNLDLTDADLGLAEESSSSSSADEDLTAPTMNLELSADDWVIDSSGGGGDDGDGASSASAPSIDWDIDCVTLDSSGAEISLDAAGSAVPAEINWDIDVTESAATDGDSSSSSSFSSSSKPSSSSSKFQSNRGSLRDVQTRHEFLSDLLELEAFFQTRVSELSDTASAFSALSALPSLAHLPTPALLANESLASAQSALTCVTDLLQALRDPALHQLIMIRTSNKYVDRLVNSLEQQRAYVTKMADMATGLEERIAQHMANIRGTHPLLQRMVGQTRELQRQVESALSAQYEGRTVNIIGEINTIGQ